MALTKEVAVKQILDTMAEAYAKHFPLPTEQEPVYKMTVVDDQHPNGIPLEQWTPEDMAYRPGGLPQSAPTPEQLAALGWQSIECPFCGTSGAQAFPKPETDWEGIAADQALTIALMKSEQEPVAWMHTQLSDVAITHEPSDLKRHPERWTALYPKPKPCPTCEALARTVMLDQTSHDRPKREWVGLTEKAAELVYEDVSGQSLRPQDYRLVLQFAVAIEAKLKELNA